MSFRLPAKLAARLQDMAAVPSRAAAAIAARLPQALPAPSRGEVRVAAEGGNVVVRQNRPHGPPVCSALPASGLPPETRAVVAEETDRAMAEALRGSS
ncbi:MAG TPA: hypothetical protein VNI01_11260 [Elusimicrobiota bacterium]|nr:hypothetical protein [Elusimicrobiota bacterium]